MDQNEMNGTGYLLVRVSTALGAIPLEGATVTVREHISAAEGYRGAIIASTSTDRNGKTERIPLAAPPRAQSFQPSRGLPYALYNVDVELKGYYQRFFNAVPVYDTITSIQPAILVPIAESARQDGLSLDEVQREGGMNPALRPNAPDDRKEGES
jgi:hypothetical protein